VGLAAAILVDATLVRGVLLPAVMGLLGEANRGLSPGRQAAREPASSPSMTGSSIALATSAAIAPVGPEEQTQTMS
jgi:hypothetical protein